MRFFCTAYRWTAPMRSPSVNENSLSAWKARTTFKDSRSTRAREKRQRLILSLRPCLMNTAMLMQLAGKPMRKRTGMRTVILILSKSCLASKPIRLLGLFHGVVVFIPRMMQFSGTLLADWLMLSTVHGDVIFVSLTVVSDSRII